MLRPQTHALQGRWSWRYGARADAAAAASVPLTARDEPTIADLELRELQWRGRPEHEIRAEMEQAIARRFPAVVKRRRYTAFGQMKARAVAVALLAVLAAPGAAIAQGIVVQSTRSWFAVTVAALPAAPALAQAATDPAFSAVDIRVAWDAPADSPLSIDAYRVRLDGNLIADVPASPAGPFAILDFKPHLIEVSSVHWQWDAIEQWNTPIESARVGVMYTQPNAPPPPPPPPPPANPLPPSPDGATDPPTSPIIDSTGAAWTIRADDAILRDGIWIDGGLGSQLLWWQGVIYTLGTDLNWWSWGSATSWVNRGPNSPAAPPPPPPVVTSWPCSAVSVKLRYYSDGSKQLALKCPAATAVVKGNNVHVTKP